MRPLARLFIYAMWPPEAHKFDTSGVVDSAAAFKCNGYGFESLQEEYFDTGRAGGLVCKHKSVHLA